MEGRDMRIIIEIDDGEATVTARRGTTGAESPLPAADAQGTPLPSTPPEEVLATAEALGAQDAGPAPAVGGAATTAAQAGTTEATSPQAAALGDRDAGPVPAIAEQAPGVPPLPLAAPGPHAPVAGRGDDSPAGAAPGIPLEPPPAVRTEDDTPEGDR
jgi:hypothetical protein